MNRIGRRRQPAEGRPTTGRRAGVVERTAGALAGDRPALDPQQEQEEFERGVADDAGGLPDN